MLQTFKRLAGEEKGAAVVIIALAFTVFLGFMALAVDSGLLYLEHARLARAADSAALAGAQELPDTVKAETVARQYAQLNELDPDAMSVGFSLDNREITITASKTVSLYFAQVLGYNEKTVRGQSRARISPVCAISGLIPLGFNENLLPLDPGTAYMIKGGSQDGSPWRGIIEYPGQGNGGDNYRDLAREGFNGTVAIGDLEGKVPGNKSGPTEQGIEDRINACTDGCTWNNYEPGCPRLALVPIYRDLGEQIEVIGLATVFLESVGAENGKGNDNRVLATYINNTVSGETDDSVTGSYLYSVELFD